MSSSSNSSNSQQKCQQQHLSAVPTLASNNTSKNNLKLLAANKKHNSNASSASSASLLSLYKIDNNKNNTSNLSLNVVDINTKKSISTENLISKTQTPSPTLSRTASSSITTAGETAVITTTSSTTTVKTILASKLPKSLSNEKKQQQQKQYSRSSKKQSKTVIQQKNGLKSISILNSFKNEITKPKSSTHHRISRQYNINDDELLIDKPSSTASLQTPIIKPSSPVSSAISPTHTAPTLIAPSYDFDSNSLVIAHESLSRKSSYNSVRFAKFFSNKRDKSSSQDNSNNLNVLSNEHLQQLTPSPSTLTTSPNVFTTNNQSNIFYDLTYEAEQLENSAKKNDKYTVRRILDAHYSQFQLKSIDKLKFNNYSRFNNTQTNSNHIISHTNIHKKSPSPYIDTRESSIERNYDVNKFTIYPNQKHRQLSSASLTPSPAPPPTTPSYLQHQSIQQQQSQQQVPKQLVIPAAFINILHLAIESNSLDVLRICLKYGLNANEPGTNQKTITLTNNYSNGNIDKQRLIKYPFICKYCYKKNELYYTVAKDLLNRTKSIQALQYHHYYQYHASKVLDVIEDNTPFLQSSLSSSSVNKNQTTKINESVNYSNSIYLTSLPPLFLAISKCLHSSTELLLDYGACPNIQDEYGNTPLHLACAKKQTCELCIYLLLKYHACSSILNNLKQTPEKILYILNPMVSLQNIYVQLIGDIFTNNFNFLNNNTNPFSANLSINLLNNKYQTSTNSSSMNYNGGIGGGGGYGGSSMHGTGSSIVVESKSNKANRIMSSGNSLTNTLISSNSMKNIVMKKLKSISTSEMNNIDNINVQNSLSSEAKDSNSAILQPKSSLLTSQATKNQKLQQSQDQKSSQVSKSNLILNKLLNISNQKLNKANSINKLQVSTNQSSNQQSEFNARNNLTLIYPDESSNSDNNMLNTTKYSLKKSLSSQSAAYNKSSVSIPQTNKLSKNLINSSFNTNCTNNNENNPFLLLKQNSQQLNNENNITNTNALTPIVSTTATATTSNAPVSSHKKSISKLFNSTITKFDSKQISHDTDTFLNNKHDSVSLVSSKLSLLKKFVSIYTFNKAYCLGVKHRSNLKCVATIYVPNNR